MSLIEDMFKRKNELLVKIEDINHKVAASPAYRLICRNREKTYRYAYISENQKEIYLSEKDPLALELAKRDYYTQYLKDLQLELKSVEGYLKWHNDDTNVGKYMEKHPGIRKLLQPALIDNENKYREWADAPYERNPNYRERLNYITNGDFYVRSKAEQMIANMYLAEGIPFRYEDPVQLPSGTVIYPDFHLFSLRDYKEWYHEHNGQMTRDNYYNKYEYSLRQLRTVGIIPGVNLLQTFESELNPLDPREIRDIINRYLI